MEKRGNGCVYKLKRGKEGGFDDIVVEMLKTVDIIIPDWLLRIFNKCMEIRIMSEGWKVACIIPLCNGRGDRRNCVNYENIICKQYSFVSGTKQIVNVFERTYDRMHLKINMSKCKLIVIGNAQR